MKTSFYYKISQIRFNPFLAKLNKKKGFRMKMKVGKGYMPSSEAFS